MEIISILYFFIVILGLGYTLKRILGLKEFKDSAEEAIFLFGLGLSIFVLVSIPLGLTRLLYWYLFLATALIIPVCDIFFKIKKKERFIFRIAKKEIKIYIILGLIILTFFLVYLKGAFAYPYLEDDDPWEYAIAAKYVSIEHTYVQPNLVPLGIQLNHMPIEVLEPYPPFYGVLMGVLHQTNTESVQWVLKFFNVLLISLGLPFAYIWLKKFTNSDKIAIAAVFLLAVMPCFMSHFIWSQTLSLVLWFPALYALEKIREEKSAKWILATAMIIASILITEVFSALLFGIFFLVYFVIELAVKTFKSKPSPSVLKKDSIRPFFLAGFLGFILASFLYWLPEIIFRGWGRVIVHLGFDGVDNVFVKGSTLDTSGNIIYGIKDFIIIPAIFKIESAYRDRNNYFWTANFVCCYIFLANKKNSHRKTSIFGCLFDLAGGRGVRSRRERLFL